MRDLQAPKPGFVGAFRGEAGLENIQVRIAGRYGVAAPDDITALLDAGVLCRTDEGRKEFPVEAVKVEFLLQAV